MGWPVIEQECVMTPKSVQSPLDGVTVLVVEDEIIVALDLALALEDAGATVAGPLSRLDDAGLDAAHAAPADVAILDVDVRGREVFPLARALLRRDVPVVFSTARRDLSAIRRRFPNAPILAKPRSSHALVHTVRDLVSARAAVA